MKSKQVTNHSLYAAIFICLVLLLSPGGCKNFGIPDYELAITIEEGVGGTPVEGVYTHTDLSVIEYRYLPENPAYTVEVLLNGSRKAAEGTITMYTDLELVARIIDIRGTWDFEMSYTPEGGETETEEFKITFSGPEILSGAFTDDRGYNGTWNIDGIVVTITYLDWYDYVLIGNIIDMNGTWESKIEDKEGTWQSGR